MMSLEQLQALQAHTATVYVDRLVAEYAVALCDATRQPATYNLADLQGYIAYGASPRGSINLVAPPGPGRAPGPQLLPAPRCPGTGPRCPAPPPGPDLPGPGRTDHPDSLLTAVLNAIPPPRIDLAREQPRMSFRWPELLWAVLLVPLVLLLWLRGENRRAQRAGVFGNPALLPSVVTARPGWRRSSPGDPVPAGRDRAPARSGPAQATAQVPRDQATIMLVTDYSTSMLN